MKEIAYKATRTGEGSALVQLMNSDGTRSRKNHHITWNADLVGDGWLDEVDGFLDMKAPNGRTEWDQNPNGSWSITVIPN